jgi:hypothetical protein
MRILLQSIVAVPILVAYAGTALACATCGLPIGDPETHAFRVSVLFMMAVPYSILLAGAVIGWVAYRNARRRLSAHGVKDSAG